MSEMSKKIWIQIGHISANNGPIWKIQNLARSGPRRRSAWLQNDAMRAMTSRAPDIIDLVTETKIVTQQQWCNVIVKKGLENTL